MTSKTPFKSNEIIRVSQCDVFIFYKYYVNLKRDNIITHTKWVSIYYNVEISNVVIFDDQIRGYIPNII